MNLLWLFVMFQLTQFALESLLSSLNKKWYLNPDHQKDACETLDISEKDFEKTLSYTQEKGKFGTISSVFNMAIFLVFLIAGGFGWAESLAKQLSLQINTGSIGTGLIFFGILGLLSMLSSLPFSYYFTFHIEEAFGFNRQSKSGFIIDLLKNLVLGTIIGGILLSGLLWIMEAAGSYWWLLAWGFMTAFQFLMVFLYPIVLAPLFNKFSPLDEGPLKDEIFALAKKVEFKASGIFVMNASIRSTHGNAFFTGISSEKRIVLFDTLIEAMNIKELVAVLAHELGHFKLNHIRSSLIRSTLIMGLTFYGLSLCLPLKSFYLAFDLEGISNYGALLVFGLWYGLIQFFITPFQTWISRKNEFEADAFAKSHVGNATDLSEALKKLRQKNHAMPLTHPWYSTVYHSHPPLMERIQALYKN